MDQPVAEASELQYEQGSSVRRRNRRRRVLVVLAFVVAGVVVWFLAPGFREKAGYLYWQHRCMNFSAPPTMVAYEDDPTRAAALLAMSGYQHPQGEWMGSTPAVPGGPAGFVPAPLLHLSPEWNCMAFVHSRTSPAGRRRLTMLHVRFAEPIGVDRVVELFGSAYTPATMLPNSWLSGSSRGRLWLPLGSKDRLRLFWGQLDPDRADHFTVGYILNDQPGTIDGYLKDDDHLDLHIRDGPAIKIATTQPW